MASRHSSQVHTLADGRASGAELSAPLAVAHLVPHAALRVSSFIQAQKQGSGALHIVVFPHFMPSLLLAKALLTQACIVQTPCGLIPR